MFFFRYGNDVVRCVILHAEAFAFTQPQSQHITVSDHVNQFIAKLESSKSWSLYICFLRRSITQQNNESSSHVVNNITRANSSDDIEAELTDEFLMFMQQSAKHRKQRGTQLYDFSELFYSKLCKAAIH